MDILNIKKLIEDKKFQEALSLLLKINIEKQTPEIKGLIGLCLYELKRYDFAKNYLIDSIVSNYDDNFAKILEDTLKKEEDYRGLLGLKLISIEKHPKNINLLREIPQIAKKIKNYDVAIEYYKILLEKCPDDYVAWNNLGLCYEEIDEWEKAYNCYKKSLSLKDFFSPNFNLGIITRKLGRYEDSIKYLKKASIQNPKSPQAKYSLSMSYMMLKDFKNGYPLYVNHMTKIMPYYYKNEWDGTPKPDKSLCIFLTGGLGDMIMYSRYFEYIKDKFKEIFVLAPEELRKTLELSFPYIKVIDSHIFFTDYDYAITPMHILKFFNLDFNVFVPNTDGFLKVEDGLAEKYQRKYFANNRLKIGINWHGNRKTTRTFFNRSCPLEAFEPIFNEYKDKAIFYSIQKDDSHTECAKYPHIIDLYDAIKDFNDTGAILKNLDLLITIDSSPLHMAGGLGVKTFALLPKANEWRWFQNDNKTIWYDSVELFRQDKERDWNSAISKVLEKMKSIY